LMIICRRMTLDSTQVCSPKPSSTPVTAAIGQEKATASDAPHQRRAERRGGQDEGRKRRELAMTIERPSRSSSELLSLSRRDS
jgi:hypothetical protein